LLSLFIVHFADISVRLGPFIRPLILFPYSGTAWIKINAFTVENVQKPARWRRFNAVSEENHRQLQQLLKLGLLIKIGGGQWNLKIHFRDGKYNIVIG